MSLQIVPIHLKNDIQPTDDLVDLILSSSKTKLENGECPCNITKNYLKT